MLRALFWITVFATVLLFGQSFAETLGAEAVADENFGHTMVLFLHQLLLVYWLGPDIAVFIWSRHVVNAKLDVEQRIVAGKMMTTIDIVPRVCLSLFLTVAGILSDTYGLPHPWWQMVGIILLGPVWLTIVLLSYLKRGSDFGDLVARFDLWLRGVLVIGIPISVSWSWSTDRLADSPWIAAKLMILAVVILLGLIMRLRLRAFFAGMNKLETDGQSVAVDTMMATSLARARPFGHAIWLLLLLASLLGIIKPGEQEPVETAALTESVAGLVQK
jgi:hypothetical protein